MGWKVIVTLLFSIFVLQFVAADLGTFEQSSAVLVKANLNATYVNVSIYYPNSSVSVLNNNMTLLAGDIWNYTFSDTNTIGIYSFYYCDQNNANCNSDTFKITYSGEDVSTGQGLLYVSLLVVLIFIFSTTIFGILQLPSKNETDEEGRVLSITWLKYLRPAGWMFVWILFLGISFLASNIAFAYLPEQLFATILLRIFQICLGVTPLIVIVWGLYILSSFFYDRKFMAMMNRGVFPQGGKF